LAPSGRAALYDLFRACRAAAPKRDEVAVAGYTCWAVVAAAVRAGLRIRPVDLDPRTFDFDESSLRRAGEASIAALVTHHLFGIPNDSGRARRFAEGAGAVLIDDAAQGFGASIGGEEVGASGEAGILSFGRGKAIASLGGGALLLPRSGPLADVGSSEGAPPRGTVSYLWASLYHLFFRPALYGIPARIPFLHIGETVYDEAFSLRPFDGVTAAIAELRLETLDGAAEERRAAAADYRRLFEGSRDARIVDPISDACSSYLRFPVLLPARRRDAVLRPTRDLGLSTSYPSPVDEIPGLPRGTIAGDETLTGCREIAASLLTLPTHPLAKAEDRAEIARRVIEGCR